MEKLQQHFAQLVQCIREFGDVDVVNMNDAKSLKSLVFVTDQIIEVIEQEKANLGVLRMCAADKIQRYVDATKSDLRYAASVVPFDSAATASGGAANASGASRAVAVPNSVSLPPNIPIPISVSPGVKIRVPVYSDRAAIPVMRYGAVVINARPTVLFRYSNWDFVSCTECEIVDATGTEHTVCCNNTPETCEYGDKCRYFHDPALWSDSAHTQRFVKTMMVKRCPYFGHRLQLRDQISTLTFENLRTLARYCATMMMYIHVCAAAP